MSIVKSFRPGDTLGKYCFVRELGRGGMGVVYLVQDTLLEREIALKLLNPALSDDEVFARRFREEARSIARILHPNVVHVNSFDSLEGHLAIDMEYVDGHSLNHFITDRILTSERVVSIAHDILQGLMLCHDVGVVHRDIKPTNILMTLAGRAKVGDFGVATAYASHMEAAIQARASSAFYLGTPRYAPPEMWEGAQPTPAWDLYSVGMLMYEALTGLVPYDATSPYAIIKLMQTAPLKPIDEVAPNASPELASLVHDLLKHDPGERVASAQNALERLRVVPEFSLADSFDMPTVRVPRAQITVPRSESLPARSGRWRVPVYLLLIAVLAGIVLTLANLHKEQGSNDIATPSPPAAQAQETLLEKQLLTKEAILASPKSLSNSAFWTFDTTVVQTGAKNESHWLMDVPKSGQASWIRAASDRGLWLLRMATANAGNLVFQGDWAEYKDAGATVFHHGRISGTGLWTIRDQQLTASLIFSDARDNSTWPWTIAAVKHAAPVFDSTFIYAFEEKPLLQPLLYHELLSQHYAWAMQVETMLPSVFGSSITVPAIAGANQDFVLDGKLTESVWRERFKDSAGQEIGLCAGAPFNTKSLCMVRSASNRLLMAFSVPHPASTPLDLEIALLPACGIPVKDSPYIVALSEHGAPLSAHIRIKSVEIRYDCGWSMAESAEDGVWTSEIVIPFSSVTKICPAIGAEPWRMNISISEPATKDTPKRVVARWGFPDLVEVIHGMKLTFQTSIKVMNAAEQTTATTH